MSSAQKLNTNADEAELLAMRIGASVRNHDKQWLDGYEEDDGKGWLVRRFPGANGKLYDTWPAALSSEVGIKGPIIVKEYGGWAALCDFYFRNEGIFHARFARQILGVLNCINELPRGLR